MSLKASGIFVNLPVKDLQRTIQFFSALGFEFDPQFTDEKAACLVIGEQMYAMLLLEEFFQTFTKKELSNAENSTEVIVALSVESRAKVDEIVDKALTSGGKPSIDAVDHGFMYERGFHDPDGHLWSLFHMDLSAFEQGE